MQERNQGEGGEGWQGWREKGEIKGEIFEGK